MLNIFFTIIGRAVMDFPLQRTDVPGHGQVAGRSRGGRGEVAGMDRIYVLLISVCCKSLMLVGETSLVE